MPLSISRGSRRSRHSWKPEAVHLRRSGRLSGSWRWPVAPLCSVRRSTRGTRGGVGARSSPFHHFRSHGVEEGATECRVGLEVVALRPLVPRLEEDDPALRRVRIRLSDRIERLNAVAERFLELLGGLDRLADDAREARAALAQLPSDKLSARDLEKLQLLQSLFIEQLHEYDFGSFSDKCSSVRWERNL